MAEISPQQKEDVAAATPDAHNAAMKIQRGQDMYKAGGEEKPSKGEVLGWYMYGLCSYFVHTVLIPIVFPLIISQTVSDPPPPPQGWGRSYQDVKCKQSEMLLSVLLFFFFSFQALLLNPRLIFSFFFLIKTTNLPLFFVVHTHVLVEAAATACNLLIL